MSRSEEESDQEEESSALYFLPKGSSEHLRAGSKAQDYLAGIPSAGAVAAAASSHFASGPARETSPLRGPDWKGKQRSNNHLGYESASSSNTNLASMSRSSSQRDMVVPVASGSRVPKACMRASKARASDDGDGGDGSEDNDEGFLSYGAGFDAHEHRSSEQIPTLKWLVGGSHKMLDGTLLQHLPRIATRPGGKSRRQGYSEYSTVEMDGGDKSSQASLELRIHTAEQRKREYWRSALANASLILSWYFFSTMISVYNKWMFSTAHYKFSYPLFVTSAHMIIQFIFSGLLLYFCGDRFIARKPNGQRPRPSFRDWASKIAPCALATAVDIGLSNLSLKTITLTFYTMCKSSNLAFVLLFAFLFRLEVIRWRLVGIIALITAGVIMMVAAETKLVLVGAVEVLTASAMGGLRWALTQMLIDREGMGLNHPVATIYWLSPIMACGLVGASLAFENWHKILGGPFFHGVVRSLRTLGLITLPGLLAFCMNLSEFALIRRTSVVTLSVAGIFKEVLTVIVASTIFGDELTPINITGLCITLIGIGLYNWLRFRILTKSSTILQSGARHGGETYGQLPGGEFSERAAFEVDGGEDEVAGGAASSRSHSRAPSIAMSETRMADAELSEAEKERRRKREEEANMAGWATSGFTSTGNGLVDTDED